MRVVEVWLVFIQDIHVCTTHRHAGSDLLQVTLSFDFVARNEEFCVGLSLARLVAAVDDHAPAEQTHKCSRLLALRHAHLRTALLVQIDRHKRRRPLLVHTGVGTLPEEVRAALASGLGLSRLLAP